MSNSTQTDLCKKLPNDDLFKTTSGVGHHWRPGFYFPDTSFESSLKQDLPDSLKADAQVPPSSHFETTTGSTHDYKVRLAEPLKQYPNYSKAPAHYKVSYLKDKMENLANRGWRRALDPSQELSETHDEFNNRPPLSQSIDYKSIQPFNLYNHHTNGPSKKIIASTENEKLKGRILYPKDQEIVRALDPYLTTNMKYHRIWDPKELVGYPKKDIATYWDCEEYPKPWGSGLHLNPIGSKSAISKQNPPMRDESVFKSATTIRQVPTKLAILPHSGMQSEYQNRYERPNDVKVKEANNCPVDPPFIQPEPSNESVFSVPGMYSTEYKNYGNRLPAIV